MNIDLSRISNANELINVLGLSDYKINDQYPADQIITDTWNFANSIWANTKDTSFTDHGIKHSLRIIEFFLKFENIFKWHSYSKLIFILAALIHDIGMQYRYWCSKELLKITEEEKTVFPALNQISDKEIRMSHCVLGFNYIHQQLKSQSENDFTYRINSIKKYADEIFQAMHVAFSHSSASEYYKDLMTNSEKWNKYTKKNIGYSMRILACILRLCDEFDCSIARIEPERLPAAELDDYGQSQWLTCYFIHNVDLHIPIDGSFNPYLEVQWQCPIEDDKFDNKIIKNFLLTNRIVKINVEKGIVINSLTENKEEDVSKLLNLELKFIETPRPNASISLDQTKRTLMIASTYKNSEGNIKEENAFANESLNAKISQEIQRITQKLEDWFYKSIDPRHYRLETHDHTNIFLNCRTLISDQTLMRDIGHFLYHYFKHKKIIIDCVLAVGTSAIPIATNFQIFQGCKCTFTMSKNKSRKINSEHTSYVMAEILPYISDSKNILIIDDIISIGDVTNGIVDEYLTNPEILNIYHFSLFRLGSRDINESGKITKYLWMCHFPWVYYWRGDGDNCDFCREGSKPLDEIDISRV